MPALPFPRLLLLAVQGRRLVEIPGTAQRASWNVPVHKADSAAPSVSRRKHTNSYQPARFRDLRSSVHSLFQHSLARSGAPISLSLAAQVAACQSFLLESFILTSVTTTNKNRFSLTMRSVTLLSVIAAAGHALADKTIWATPHDSYSSSIGVLGCKVNTNRIAYFPASVDCNNICVSLSYGGRSVTLLRVDQSGGAYDISYDAWNYLSTGSSATENPATGGPIAMEYKDVDASQCAEHIYTQGSKLPLSACNSMNFLSSCLAQPSSWVARNYALFNVLDSACTLGADEQCSLDWPANNNPSCPSTLGMPSPLTVSTPLRNIQYGTGKLVDSAGKTVLEVPRPGSNRQAANAPPASPPPANPAPANPAPADSPPSNPAPASPSPASPPLSSPSPVSPVVAAPQPPADSPLPSAPAISAPPAIAATTYAPSFTTSTRPQSSGSPSIAAFSNNAAASSSPSPSPLTTSSSGAKDTRLNASMLSLALLVCATLVLS